jgi:protein ImuA
VSVSGAQLAVPHGGQRVVANDALRHLRTRIAKIEGHTQSLNTGPSAQAWTSGLQALDAALGGGLQCGAMHEIVAASPVDLPVASAFALLMLARLKRRGPFLWCMSSLTGTEYGAPYMPGLAVLGIDAARMINVKVRHHRDLSFVLEEAARLPSLAAIIAEGPMPSFTASRRLALLLAASKVPLLYLPDTRTGQASAAATRLVVSPVAASDSVSDRHPLDIRALDVCALDIRSPGPPAFHVTLARTRGGRPGLQFETVFDHANLSFTPLSFVPPGFAPPVGTPLSGASSDGIADRQFLVGDAAVRQQRA